MSTVETEFSLSSWKMPTDGSWWEIPIGDPLKGVSDGELGLKGTTIISLSATVKTDAELVNGLRIDHFTLYELAPGTPAPAVRNTHTHTQLTEI